MKVVPWSVCDSAIRTVAGTKKNGLHCRWIWITNQIDHVFGRVFFKLKLKLKLIHPVLVPMGQADKLPSLRQGLESRSFMIKHLKIT